MEFARFFFNKIMILKKNKKIEEKNFEEKKVEEKTVEEKKSDEKTTETLHEEPQTKPEKR